MTERYTKGATHRTRSLNNIYEIMNERSVRPFNIQTLGDVLLLVDIFEAFRSTCLNTYKLDPLHYYTVPGLTFDAMSKTTKIQLELLTDVDKVLFIKQGIRGGVSQCSNRYAKANNKY